MAEVTMRLQVRIAWWLTYLYLPAMKMLVWMGGEPDEAKLERVVRKALTVQAVK